MKTLILIITVLLSGCSALKVVEGDGTCELSVGTFSYKDLTAPTGTVFEFHYLGENCVVDVSTPTKD